jgi:hypothetical protein
MELKPFLTIFGTSMRANRRSCFVDQRLIMISALAIIRRKDRRAIFHERGSLCFSTIISEITPTPMKNGKIARAELKILKVIE